MGLGSPEHNQLSLTSPLRSSKSMGALRPATASSAFGFTDMELDANGPPPTAQQMLLAALQQKQSPLPRRARTDDDF